MKCKYKNIKDWPGCFEDCGYAGTNDCLNHIPKTTSIKRAITEQKLREKAESMPSSKRLYKEALPDLAKEA